MEMAGDESHRPGGARISQIIANFTAAGGGINNVI